MSDFSELEEIHLTLAWRTRPQQEEISEELPTYVDEQGRAIRVCPPRWASGISPQNTAIRTKRIGKYAD